ncbi:MAG: hypothetical protein RLZZ624_447 [Cyanobacteriota bacterium]
MQDTPSTASRTRINSSTPFTGMDRLEGLDDRMLDEPLASGQRKRYLASLGHGASRG